MTYAEIVAQRMEFDEHPKVRTWRDAFEASLPPSWSTTRYPWHGVEPRPGEYMHWDVECAWREWLQRSMEA